MYYICSKPSDSPDGTISSIADAQPSITGITDTTTDIVSIDAFTLNGAAGDLQDGSLLVEDDATDDEPCDVLVAEDDQQELNTVDMSMLSSHDDLNSSQEL